MIDASVIIVSYNVRDLLLRCLESVRAATVSYNAEVFVVDNGSRDGTVERVREQFPDVILITNQANRGFGAANNQAIARARGRAVLLLNCDAELHPDALDTMLRYLVENVDVGVIGPRLFYPDGRTQSSRRRFPTPLIAMVESTRLQTWWPNCPLLNRYYRNDGSDDEIQDVDWLVGACLLVRREVIETVGWFDERFFMYSEELDLCRRVRSAGWRVVYLPTARAIHHEGRSSEQNLAQRAQNFHESKCRYFEKYSGQSTARALRIFLLTNTLLDLGEESIKFALGHRRELRRARIASLAKVACYQLRRLAAHSEATVGMLARGASCE